MIIIIFIIIIIITIIFIFIIFINASSRQHPQGWITFSAEPEGPQTGGFNQLVLMIYIRSIILRTLKLGELLYILHIPYYG